MMTKLANLVGATVSLALVVGVVAAATTVSAQTLSPAGEGRRAWLKYNCYGCHGMRAQGGMGPNIQHEGDDVGEAVLEGEDGGMPSFRPYLTQHPDPAGTTGLINNLRAYLQSIGTANEPRFTHWWDQVPKE